MSFDECNENSYLVNERQQEHKRSPRSLVVPQYKKREFHFLTFMTWVMLTDFSESVTDPFSELIMDRVELQRLLALEFHG